MIKYIMIFFEDGGQDFFYWVYEEATGKLINCGPFQYGCWVEGLKTFVCNPGGVTVGKQIYISTVNGALSIKYRIEKIKRFKTKNIDAYWKRNKKELIK